jgi:NAD(P)H-hydrate epimerase
LSHARVTTATQSTARDLAAIASGTPSFTLMLRAGTEAAAVILRDMSDRLHEGVALYAGVGNNGGDAYIVAAQLARAGIRVRLHAAAPPRTADAQRAAKLAARVLVHGTPTGRERVVVDGLLGTGHRGRLREDVSTSCAAINAARAGGAFVVALDMPTGMNATTGEASDDAVLADVTVTFGTIKRGLLVSRAHAGRIVLVDIGLDHHATAPDDAWVLVDDRTVASMLPPLAWNAYKSRRGQLAIVGGAAGMAGASVLAARAALGAGAGLVHGWIDAASLPALQNAVPQAIAHAWPAHEVPTSERDAQVAESSATTPIAAPAPWGTAMVLGPGLGRDARSSEVLWRALEANAQVPLLLDADALTLLSALKPAQSPSRVPEPAQSFINSAADTIRGLSAKGRVVVCTPHPGEFARMLGAPVPADWQAKADALHEFAARAGATVLLKGTPTLIASADDSPLVVMPRGTPALATGGSGDLLSGIIGALLAQGLPGTTAAVLGATAHAMAAEIATARVGGEVRGLTLADVLDALPRAWQQMRRPHPCPPGVLYALPGVCTPNGAMP